MATTTRYFLKCGVTYYGRRYNAASGGTNYTGGSSGTYTDNAIVFNTWNMMDGDWFDVEVCHAQMDNEFNHPGFDFVGRTWDNQYVNTPSLIWRVTCRQPDGDIHKEPYLEISIPNLTNKSGTTQANVGSGYNDYRLPPFSIRTVLVDSVQNRLTYLGMTREEFTPVWDGTNVPKFPTQYTCIGNDVPTQNIYANITSQIHPGLFRTPIGMQLNRPSSYHAYRKNSNSDSLFTYSQSSGIKTLSGLTPEVFEKHFHSRTNRSKLACIEKTIKNSTKNLSNENYPFCKNWGSYPTRGTGKTTGNPVFAGPVLGGNYSWSNERDYEQIISIISGPDNGPNVSDSYSSGTLIGAKQYISAWQAPTSNYIDGNNAWHNLAGTMFACSPFEFQTIGSGSSKYCSLSIFRISKSSLTLAKSHTQMGDSPNYTNMPYMCAFKYSDRSDIVKTMTRHQLVDKQTGMSSPFTFNGVIPTWYTTYLGSDAYPLFSHNCGVIGTGSSGNLAKTAAYTIGTNDNYIADTLVGKVFDGLSWGNDPEGISDDSITSRNGSIGIYITTCAYTATNDTVQIPGETYAHDSFWGDNGMLNCIIHPSLFSDWPALDVYGLTDTTNNKPLFWWNGKTTMGPYPVTTSTTINDFNAYNDTVHINIFGRHQNQ